MLANKPMFKPVIPKPSPTQQAAVLKGGLDFLIEARKILGNQVNSYFVLVQWKYWLTKQYENIHPKLLAILKTKGPYVMELVNKSK
jgi:hypothetical protein